jgi:hypothetical protein
MVEFAVVVVASPVLNLAFARKHSDLISSSTETFETVADTRDSRSIVV